MKTVQYPLGISPDKVRALHAYYEAHTRRKTLLTPRIESGWVSLLSATTLAGEEVTMEDVQLVVRYLAKRVGDDAFRRKYGPRHAGCLKLTLENFFDVEKFRNDLAEARSLWSRIDAAKRTPRVVTEQQQAGDVRFAVETKREREPQPIGSVAAEVMDQTHAKFLEELAQRKERRQQP